MPMICDDPRMAAYFLDSEGKSFARHEHELYMPLLLKDLPEDSESYFTQGKWSTYGWAKK